MGCAFLIHYVIGQLRSKDIAVCTHPSQNQRQNIRLDLVHQQPVRLNMALTVSFVIAVNS